MAERFTRTNDDTALGDPAYQAGGDASDPLPHFAGVSYGESTTLAYTRFNGTSSVPTTVVDGDVLSSLVTYGYNGTDVKKATGIYTEVEVDGSDYGYSIEFRISEDGDAEPIWQSRVTKEGTLQLRGLSGGGVQVVVTDDDGKLSASTLAAPYSGPWTPQLEDVSNNEPTYTEQIGTFDRNANAVLLSAYAELASKGSMSGALFVKNFPFPIDNAADGNLDARMIIPVDVEGVTTPNQSDSVRLKWVAGNTTAALEIVGDYGETIPLEASHVDADAVFEFSGSYRTYGVALPDAPTSLVATAISSTAIDLAWTDVATNETGYRVETSADGSTGWTTVTTLPSDADSYSVTGLTSGTTYYYRVFAFNGAGDSPASNVDSAETEVWSPSEITPAIWFQDDSGFTDVSGHAEEWFGLAPEGSEINLDQPTASHRPEIKTALINGKDALRFDGSDDHYDGDSNLLGVYRDVGYAWIAAVYYKTDTDVSPGNRIILKASAGGSDSFRFGMVIGHNSSGNQNKIQVGGRNSDGGPYGGVYSTSSYSQEWVMALGLVDFQGRTVTLYIDGEEDNQATGLWSGSSNTTDSASWYTIVGADRIGGYLNADLPFLCSGTESLTTDDVDKLFGYMAHRYDLTDSLPALHPYKSTPP